MTVRISVGYNVSTMETFYKLDDVTTDDTPATEGEAPAAPSEEATGDAGAKTCVCSEEDKAAGKCAC